MNPKDLELSTLRLLMVPPPCSFAPAIFICTVWPLAALDRRVSFPPVSLHPSFITAVTRRPPSHTGTTIRTLSQPKPADTFWAGFRLMETGKVFVLFMHTDEFVIPMS